LRCSEPKPYGRCSGRSPSPRGRKAVAHTAGGRDRQGLGRHGSCGRFSEEPFAHLGRLPDVALMPAARAPSPAPDRRCKPMTASPHGPLRVGIGGPVGSGKTALMEALCKAFRARYDICAITNDIYTKEDALILTRAGALAEERIMGVETGGGPHPAIPEDASIN